MRSLRWTSGWAMALALVLVWVGCGSDDEDPLMPPPANRTPRIDSFSSVTAERAQLPGETVALNVTASDPDGDTLTLTWSLSPGSRGSLSATSGSNTVWTAPVGAGVDTVEVTVSDDEFTVSTTTTLRVGTELGGTVDGTWDLASSPFVVTEDVTVTGALTIEPGVEIFFRREQTGVDFRRKGILVQGSLIAQGTSSQRIVLQGANTMEPAPQHNGIKLELSGSATLAFVQILDAELALEHTGSGDLSLYRCRIRSSVNGYRSTGTSALATIRQTDFQDVTADAISALGGTLTLVRSELEDCGTGLALRGTTSPNTAVVDSCTFDSNTNANIFVTGGAQLSVDSCNMFKDGEEGINVEFGGASGSEVALTNCYWGLLNAGSEVEEITATFDNAAGRPVNVTPWALGPIDITSDP